MPRRDSLTAPGEPVRVAFTKWGGRPHWEYDARLLGTDEHGTWLGARAGTTLRRPGVTIDAPQHFVTLVPDAGGFVEHGRVADEVAAMAELMGAPEALFAATHSARQWLGLPVYELGAPADLVIFTEDPRLSIGVLQHPAVVIRSGVIRAGRDAPADRAGGT